MAHPPELLADDAPDHRNLRKAARAAIVVPLIFALGIYVIGDDSIAVYAVFASFVGLVFADFGGSPLRKAMSYLTMGVLGCAVIVLGAVLSTVPAAGVMGMFAVMFVATLATVYGGQTPLHVAPLALAYSLSVLQPLRDLAIADRLAGWAIGSGAALLAASVMWPAPRRIGLSAASAELAGVLERTVEVLDQPQVAARRMEEARQRADDLVAGMATPMRPFGPTRQSIAVVHLADHLVHAVDLLGDVIDHGRMSADDVELAADVAAALGRTQSVLRGELEPSSATDGLERLDRARASGIARLRAEAARPAAATTVLDGVRSAVPLLALSHVTMWIEYEAGRAMGSASPPGPELTTVPGTTVASDTAPRTAVRRARSIIASELDPDGVILENSVRAGAALAAAVALAEALPLQHGFWIVLAAMCVVRSGASSTYTTARQAIIGTACGFAVSTVVVLVIGDSPVALWAIFPVVVAIAAYSPGAIDFAVGQAAFTVLVVVLFGLLDLPGFQTAEVRVATVAVGVLAAVVLSLVMWPRGARAALARTMAGVYLVMAGACATFVTGTPEQREHARHQLAGARRRAEAAFAVALAEGAEPVDVEGWMAVYRPSTVALAMTAGLIPSARPREGGCADASASARTDADAVGGECQHVATSLTSGTSVELRRLVLVGQDTAFEHCAREAADDPESALDAIVLTGWSMFIGRLASDIARSADALDALATSARRRAWLAQPSPPAVTRP